MTMPKTRKGLQDKLKRKYNYCISSAAGSYVALTKVNEDGYGEINIFLDARDENLDPMIDIRAYINNISFEELALIAKIAEEFKKEIEEKRESKSV